MLYDRSQCEYDRIGKADEVTFGGIVTSVNERFSQKTGKPFGFVTIEDFEGTGELALFGDDWHDGTTS